jgi:predicted Ser/Thr protein kinase
MESLVGKTLGQYQIVQELGRGGMAVVYKAYQPSLTRYVAIKVLPPQLSFDEDFVERFVREARGAAMLHHPNIITIHDVSEQDGIHYFVMEYLTGKTLDAVLGGQPMPLPRISRIIDQVADALDHAHSQGLLHRDIKPSNICVDEARGDHVVLMDFGLVRAGQDSKLTKTGMIVGTPEYMSPEQAQGEEVDYRTDIYSLGVVLYRMLTGTAPFVRSTPAAVLLAHVAYEPPPVSQINPSVPKPVEAVVLKAMAKDRDQRYQSAGQLARDLHVAITGQMPEGLTVPIPAARAAAPPPTLVATPTTASLTPARQQPAAAPGYTQAAPTTAAPMTVATTPPQPFTAATPSYAPTTPKKAGGTSPLIYIGLGVAGLVVLCVAGIAVAAALGLFKPGAGPATPQVLTPQAVEPSPGVTLLAAPTLKEPADSATFSPKDTIQLSWEAVSGLAANDSYVVTLECAASTSGPQKIQVKGTSYTVQSSLYDSLSAPYQCRWNVMVTGQGGAARSASSQTRQFSWSQPTATATAQPSATLAATPTSTSTSTATPRPLPTNTRPPARTPTPEVTCSGGRTWNGTECVCPPDKPEWFNGQCIEKGKGGGGGGGGNNTPAPP